MLTPVYISLFSELPSPPFGFAPTATEAVTLLGVFMVGCVLAFFVVRWIDKLRLADAESRESGRTSRDDVAEC